MLFQEANALKRNALSATLQRHWFSVLLLLLPVAAFASSHIALVTAFIFTFLVPGLIALNFFKLKPYETVAFVPVFSVLVSTQLVYYVSLLAGYSSATILGVFIGLAAVQVVINLKKGRTYDFRASFKACPFSKKTMAIFLFVFVLVLVVLCRSVWFENASGIVVTGSNWQDTPLHYEIIATSRRKCPITQEQK